MYEWGERKSFYVAIGSIQAVLFCHTLKFTWGELCKFLFASINGTYACLVLRGLNTCRDYIHVVLSMHTRSLVCMKHFVMCMCMANWWCLQAFTHIVGWSKRVSLCWHECSTSVHRFVSDWFVPVKQQVKGSDWRKHLHVVWPLMILFVKVWSNSTSRGVARIFRRGFHIHNMIRVAREKFLQPRPLCDHTL